MVFLICIIYKGDSMKYEITESTSGSICILELDKNEEIRIERGSMVYKTPNIELVGKTNGE